MTPFEISGIHLATTSKYNNIGFTFHQVLRREEVYLPYFISSARNLEHT